MHTKKKKVQIKLKRLFLRGNEHLRSPTTDRIIHTCSILEQSRIQRLAWRRVQEAELCRSKTNRFCLPHHMAHWCSQQRACHNPLLLHLWPQALWCQRGNMCNLKQKRGGFRLLKKKKKHESRSLRGRQYLQHSQLSKGVIVLSKLDRPFTHPPPCPI